MWNVGIQMQSFLHHMDDEFCIFSLTTNNKKKYGRLKYYEHV